MPAARTQRPAVVCSAAVVPLRTAASTPSSPDSSPHVDPAQTGRRQPGQPVGPLLINVRGGPVDRDPFEPGKDPAGRPADLGQAIGTHGDGVACRQKQGAHRGAAAAPGGAEIRHDVGHRPLAVGGPGLVNHAEGAAVPGATDGGLDKQAVGLAGRPVDGAFVAHGRFGGSGFETRGCGRRAHLVPSVPGPKRPGARPPRFKFPVSSRFC